MKVNGFFENWMNQPNKAWENPSWWMLAAYWVFIPVMVFSIYFSHQDAEIAKRQKTVLTAAISIDSGNHGCLSYKFDVDRHTYAGCGVVKDAKVNDIIRVYYDPLNPAHNNTMSFQDASSADLFFMPFLILASIIAPLFIWWRRRVSRMRSSSSN